MADTVSKAAGPTSRPTLLADIGGTNTRVALARGGAVDRDTIRKFSNAAFRDLSAVLAAYLAELGVADCAGACVAVAGPVQDGRAEMTNLSWTITSDAVAKVTGAPTVAIINDLQAQGHALDRISADSLRTVLPGSRNRRKGARLVVGVGTGFNAAPVHRTARGLLVAPSECGHASLPVRTGEEVRLARFVEEAHGFAGIEDALSGRGVERVYAWAATEAGNRTDLPAAEVLKRIAGGADPVAQRTCATFVSLLGRVASDLALVHLPFEGIFLIGGVARAFTPYFATHGFAGAFFDKGRFSDFLRDFAVSIVEDDFAALEGCAGHLDELMAG